MSSDLLRTVPDNCDCGWCGCDECLMQGHVSVCPAFPSAVTDRPLRKVEDYPLAPCPKCGVEVTTAYDWRDPALQRWHAGCGWKTVPNDDAQEGS